MEIMENMGSMETDTIAAIATGMTEAGIGIIRVSGSSSIETVDSIFRTRKGEKKLRFVNSHTANHGYVVDKDGEIIDEVMAVVMKAPKSYTGEDTVEINCHGGILVMRKVLEEVLKNGARLAEPGEFTKRAFLNGKMDLSEAEAVMDLIHSGNEWALKASVRQLQGSVSEKIRSLRAKIIYEIAFIESALDDPEHFELEGYPEGLFQKIQDWKEELKRLIDSASYGKLVKEGINTVIVGKPNVGKSSLLNLLAGEDLAIVTEVAGTTRDVLQESVMLHGISLNIMDTAGIRSTEDVVEKIGVEKARNLIKEADLVLLLVDASVPLDKNDEEIFSLISLSNTILLLNKSDLNVAVGEEDVRRLFEFNDASRGRRVRIIRTSTLEHTGMEALEKEIIDLFFQGKIMSGQEVTITNLRHKEALENARESLERVEGSIEERMPEDFFSIDLMDAYGALGKIIGEEVGEDLVNEIFSKFCMGK